MENYKSLETYLLNKEVFCIKTISNIDFGAIISAWHTILVTDITCEQIRDNCQYIEIKFSDFSGEGKEVKIYIDGNFYSLCEFVKTTFYPVHETFLKLSEKGTLV